VKLEYVSTSGTTTGVTAYRDVASCGSAAVDTVIQILVQEPFVVKEVAYCKLHSMDEYGSWLGW
jgi:hypothetical protein